MRPVCFALKWMGLLVLPLSGWAAGPVFPDPQPQRDAMHRIAWLAGEWRGQATMQRGPNKESMFSWERVTSAAGGLALLVQGRHHTPNTDGTPGTLVHDTAGMITFSAETGRYRFATQLATGQGGSFDATFEDDRFKWFMPMPAGQVRYEIYRNAKGQWTEEGYFCPTAEGAPCQPFFAMTLDRQ